jgi:hypothetical protein
MPSINISKLKVTLIGNRNKDRKKNNKNKRKTKKEKQ